MMAADDKWIIHKRLFFYTARQSTNQPKQPARTTKSLSKSLHISYRKLYPQQ